ncbi:MAG TPA: superoxide dismutase [Acidimicrobiales bacterium]|jgi:superoxide dismutase, Fe-Mn family|nr:superoxide dismutase [Acidimicrobiales bacterium]
MAFELPPLPYPRDALAPHMSEQTLDFHYGKHHQTYVTNLNGLVDGTENAGKSLEEIIQSAEPGGLFNNAAQVWNHTFFWNCMSPGGGGDPDGDLATAIDAAFGSVDGFKQTFTDKAKTLFGSGWTWLAKGDDGGLEILQTKDADLPLKHGKTALLTLDVWEHAYYLDYQNARPAYIETWLNNLVNWEFAAENLAKS